MGPRTGTPMRLVSPAPVLVPPGGPRAPQAPPLYPPQPQSAQQSLYSTQNGSSVGGNFYGYILTFIIKTAFSIIICTKNI